MMCLNVQEVRKNAKSGSRLPGWLWSLTHLVDTPSEVASQADASDCAAEAPSSALVAVEAPSSALVAVGARRPDNFQPPSEK